MKQTGVRAASGGSSSQPTTTNGNIVRISASSNDNNGVAKIVSDNQIKLHSNKREARRISSRN